THIHTNTNTHTHIQKHTRHTCSPCTEPQPRASSTVNPATLSAQAPGIRAATGRQLIHTLPSQTHTPPHTRAHTPTHKNTHSHTLRTHSPFTPSQAINPPSLHWGKKPLPLH